MTRSRQPRTRTELEAANRVRHIAHAIAADIRAARLDAGLSLRQLAAAAGVSASSVKAIEQTEVEPTLRVVARIAGALGMSVGFRLYPGTGPLVRDHLQMAMINALLQILDGRWRPSPEVPVNRPVRGVIDLVLDDDAGGIVIACEAQSELRRLEQQLRWSKAKADALRFAREADHRMPTGSTAGRLLLLRSTFRTRAAVAQYAQLVRAAYPARSRDAYAALAGDGAWTSDAVLWCRIEGGRSEILVHPPRGVAVGR